MTRPTTTEPWPEYIRRATATAENHLQRLQIETWTTTYLTRKWRWAARIANQPSARWTRLASTWQPEYNLQRPATRRQARPHKRWSDDFQTFLATIHTQPPLWLDAAGNHTNWAQLEPKFITYMNTSATQPRQRSQPAPPTTTTTAETTTSTGNHTNGRRNPTS